MTPEAVFSFTGPPVLLGWAILILAPRRWPPLNVIPAVVIPAGLAALYSALILRFFAEAEGGFSTLASVRALFASDWMLLAGWVHYLAFDMFIGAWLARRMDGVGIGRLIQAGVLLGTFLLGPLGFLIGLVTVRTLAVVSTDAANRAVR